MILKKLLVAIAMTGVFAGAQAQMYWKVTEPETGTTSYMLGTHHFAPVSFLDNLAGLDSALSKCGKLYGEIIMADMMKPEYMMQMQQQMMAPADSTLDKLLGAEQLDSLKAVWKEYGNPQLPEQVMPMLKPAAIGTQLAAFMAAKVFPSVDFTNGIDQAMQTRARNMGKPVDAFETADYQLQVLFGKSIADQAEELMKTVRDVKGPADKMKKLTDAYMSQDFGTLTEMFEDAYAEDPAGTETLIYGRNDRWVERLDKEMRTTPLFVVVGAGHLVGDRGLVTALRNLGFKVEPAN